MVREMIVDDLGAVIDLQHAGAVIAMAAVFPQDRYPFPRDTIVARWRADIKDPATATSVAVDDGRQLVGFAATTGRELLHFGTAVGT